MSGVSEGERNVLLGWVRDVLVSSYSRYSGFEVRAAILTERGNFFVVGGL